MRTLTKKHVSTEYKIHFRERETKPTQGASHAWWMGSTGLGTSRFRIFKKRAVDQNLQDRLSKGLKCFLLR